MAIHHLSFWQYHLNNSMVQWVLMVFFCMGVECVQLVTEPYPHLAECDINRHMVTAQILATEGITFFQIRCDQHHAPQI